MVAGVPFGRFNARIDENGGRQAVIDWRAVVAVACGAAAGGVLRYVIGVLTVARLGGNLAWVGTGFINVSGSFLIGVVLELAVRDGGISPLGRLFLATGVLGGYTTFSTFSWETMTLGRESETWLAVGYAAGSVLLGIAAALAGSVLTRLAVR